MFHHTEAPGWEWADIISVTLCIKAGKKVQNARSAIKAAIAAFMIQRLRKYKSGQHPGGRPAHRIRTTRATTSAGTGDPSLVIVRVLRSCPYTSS